MVLFVVFGTTAPLREYMWARVRSSKKRMQNVEEASGAAEDIDLAPSLQDLDTSSSTKEGAANCDIMGSVAPGAGVGYHDQEQVLRAPAHGRI